MPDSPSLSPRILIVDDDRVLARSLAALLTSRGYATVTAHSGREAEAAMEAEAFAAILLEPESIDSRDAAMGWMANVHRRHPAPAIIIVTAHGSVAGAVASMRPTAGAVDYLVKPVPADVLCERVERAIRGQHLLEEVSPDAAAFGECLGTSDAMAQVFAVAQRVAESRATVLIVGESGTGKSMLARAIHAHSPRHEKAFVEVACGSLPETLLESELFGHVAGAFTDAHADKPGRFELADGGSLFLDEIHNASPQLQVKLLRVLQEGTFERVGSSETRHVDARILLATNVDLESLVAAGTFRQDLYYRVSVVPLRLPALRERRDEMPALAARFLERFRRENGRQTLGFSVATLAAMQRYDWPGNIRELENAVQHAVVVSTGATIETDDLPERVRDAASASQHTALATSPTSTSSTPLTLEAALETPERQVIEAALGRNGWCRIATARELGIDRTTLYKKMRKHGLGRRDAA